MGIRKTKERNAATFEMVLVQTFASSSHICPKAQTLISL